MKRLLFGIAIASCLSFSGCASSPQNAEQTVFAAQASYTAAVAVAVAYKNLPTCGPVAPKLCSDLSVVKKLQDADNLAAPTLQAAQNIVRQPDAGLNVQTAVTMATQAVAILSSLTSTLTVK